MKKIKIIGIILLMFITTNVYAEPVSWPNTFTHGDYKYEITEVKINIYEMKLDSNDNVDENDSNNYLTKNPTNTFSLVPDEFTIEPEYKDDKMSNIDATYINLNLNITKEDLENLLADEIAAATTTKSYYADLVVTYKLLNYPSAYQHFYQLNTLSAFAGEEVSTGPTETDITHEQEQVINTIIIEKTESGSTDLYYETRIGDNFLELFITNYLALSDESIASWGIDPDYIIMFHNIENIEKLIENYNYNDLNNYDDDYIEEALNPKTGTEAPSQTDVVVKTPNTAEKIPTYMYILSISCIILGLSIMGYAYYRSKKGLRI